MTLRRPPLSDLAPSILIAAAAILGVTVGQTTYYLATSQLPLSRGPAWWFAGGAAALLLALAVHVKSSMLKASLILLALAKLTLCGGWAVPTGITAAAAVLSEIACWRLVTRRVKAAAIIIALLAAPVSVLGDVELASHDGSIPSVADAGWRDHEPRG